MYQKENDKISDKNMAEEVLKSDFYKNLYEIKDHMQLDKTPFGYEYSCVLANGVLAKHGFFLKFFERRDKFRYQVKESS